MPINLRRARTLGLSEAQSSRSVSRAAECPVHSCTSMCSRARLYCAASSERVGWLTEPPCALDLCLPAWYQPDEAQTRAPPKKYAAERVAARLTRMMCSAETSLVRELLAGPDLWGLAVRWCLHECDLGETKLPLEGC